MEKVYLIIIVTAIVIIAIGIAIAIYNKDFFNSEKELTFQEEAVQKIGTSAFPNFLNCITKDPNTCIRTGEVLSIRDNTDILNFAYFPLKDGVIKYNKIILTVH